MSIGPTGGITGSAAGAPLSQSQSKDVEQAQRDSATQRRQVDTDRQAENASGVGQTKEDSASSERDADGRRLWERPTPASPHEDSEETDEESNLKQSIDTSGTSGNQLDLTG